MSNQETQPKNKKLGKLKNSSIFTNKLALVFVLMFAAIGAYLILSTNAARKPTSNAVTLSLVPSSQRLSVNQTLTVEVRLNTNNEAVNAVQADFTYPANNLEFVNIDTTGSAFGVEAPSSGGNGTVSIVRGSITPQNASNLSVAKVTFRAIANGRKLPLNLTSSSVVIRAADTVNVLQKMTGTQVTVQ